MRSLTDCKWFPVNDPKKIKVSQLRPGPIRHETLPKELLDRINVVHPVVGPVLDLTLEEFEIGFMRDAHPEREVAVWSKIAGAWLNYQQVEGNRSLADAEGKALLGALIQISSGVDDPGELSVPIDVGRRLIACYST